MSTPSADQDLLFGLLAWQLHFLSRDQLTAALAAWAADRSRPLAEVLRERGALGDDELGLLAELTRRHLARHGHDLRQSLATLATPGTLGPLLEHIADEAIQTALLSAVAVPPDNSDRTRGPDGKADADLGTPVGSGGRFRVLRPHAKGGLGQVSVALDGELNREVALKEIQEQYADDPQSRTRFLLEAEVTGGLEHPGVVPVYSLGKHPDGRPFYAMRFIRGDSLKDAIDRFHRDDKPGRDEGERTLALRQLLGRFVDVCEAVAYAHSRGVLHRDLKPSNVMLGQYGETLVVDWGLAKPLGQRQPAEGAAERTLRPTGAKTPAQTQGVVGTPAYMSPEQAGGRAELLSPASDVYSLGATLYALLTGKPPVEDSDLNLLLGRVQLGDYPRPRQVKPGVPPALEAVCLKAMALKPEDRYGSAKELAEEVEHWLAGEPVRAWPEPWPVRVSRWLKRHRTLVTSGVAAVAVAAVALAGATGLLKAAYEGERHAREDEAAARAAAEKAEARAQAQRNEALKQKQRADDNFAKAKKAVEDYLTQVTEHPRLKWQGFQDLRKELLKTAVPFYDDFVKQKADDPKLEAERGSAYWKLALIRAELGETKQAVRDFQVMQGIFRRLADAYPTNLDYHKGLAASHNNLGWQLSKLGRWGAAEESYGEAIRLYQALAKAHPAKPEHSAGLARSHHNLGNLLRDVGKGSAAETSFREAIRLQKALTDALPASTQYRQELAGSHHDLGFLLHELDKRQEAEKEYGESLRLYQALAEAHPSVPHFRGLLAGIQRDLALLLRDLDRRPEAEEATRTAIRLFSALAEAHPALPDYRNGLAESRLGLGRLLHEAGKVRWREAEQATREAIKLSQALTDAHPAVRRYRSNLATGRHSLGLLLRDLGRRRESEESVREAIKLYQALADNRPGRPRDREALAACHNLLGILLRAAGKNGDAASSFREAIEIQKALADFQPAVPKHRVSLAGNHCNLAQLLSDTKQVAAALAEVGKAVTLLEDLQNKEQLSAQGRVYLRNSYGTRAIILDRLQRPGDAAGDWERAARLDAGPSRNQFWLSRSLSLARAGKHARATAEAEALAKGNPSGADLYKLARVYALSVSAARDDEKLQERYATRAVEFLGRAHGTGYFGDAKFVANLKKDADLDPLRQRDDFRKLLTQVEKAP
jgi:serine/threonine-protein kinase